MADLIDSGRENIPEDRRLRLSIRWRHIVSEPSLAQELDGVLSIGLFIGDTPLFAPVVYGPKEKRSASASKKPGYFYGEDNGCALLYDLWRALRTGELIDVEDYIENFFRLIVSPSGPLCAPACA